MAADRMRQLESGWRPEAHRSNQAHAGDECRSRRVNVGDAERWLSLLAGGTAAALGIARGRLGGLTLAAFGGMLIYRGLTGHCHLYAALGMDTSEPRSPQSSIPAGHGTKVEETITVTRPREELYRFWRDFSQLPRVMRHLKSVEVSETGRSRWVAEGPGGMSVAWDAVIITERENELIGWKSIDGSAVDTAGSVHFSSALGGRGTEVRVVLKYDPPGGKLGAAAAWLLGADAQRQIRDDLARFKNLMESGSLAREPQPA